MIRKPKEQLKLTSVVVTHDMALARKVADRVVFLHKARAAYFGPMSSIYEAMLRAEARLSERDASEARVEEVLAEPGAIRWEGAVFERVTSIERQLGALEENLGKRVPEVESRLLHLLESRLGALETELHRRVSDLATDVALDADRNRGDLRRVLWAIAAVGVLVLLF